MELKQVLDDIASRKEKIILDVDCWEKGLTGRITEIGKDYILFATDHSQYVIPLKSIQVIRCTKWIK